MVITNYEDYVSHALLALKYGKYVFVEKPMAMNFQDADAIIAAEKNSQGKVFVGYLRRYAPAFLDAVGAIANMDKILYARVRGMLLLLAMKYGLSNKCSFKISLGPILPSSRRVERFLKIFRQEPKKTSVKSPLGATLFFPPL
jgi:GFO/IDH/MocA oxidoreductase family protein